MDNTEKKGNMIAGMVSGGCILTGLCGFIAALVSFLSGRYEAAGVLLIASSLSFGLLSIAVFGK